ncbi:MAG: protein-glutamate O-methyltransferase CheR [Candidatus Hydrothermarchaeales archaeon]
MFSDDAYFEKLKKKVTKDINFQSQYYGEKHLKRRFMVRMRALNIETFRDYFKQLERDPEEYNYLIKILTVNVTEWFRDADVFEAFQKQVLPDIISRKKMERNRTIRIWSAGCSDGKEPYSIAMLLHEVLGERINDFYIVLYASDIDEEMLEKSKAGWYPPNEMKGLKDEYRRVYFTKEGDGYRVKPELKRLVKFEKLDLTTDRKHLGIDVLFCRNVVIYFTKELKQRLYMDFYNILKYGGYLIMGKTESLMGEARPMFTVVDNRERIYQKL